MPMTLATYRDIVENLHDGLYCVDRDRVITYWNPAAERITGFTAGEVMGRPCADNILTHVDDAGCSLCLGRCPLAATMQDGVAREANVHLHHKQGHRVPVAVRTSVLAGADGSVIGGVELFTDGSRQELQSQRLAELEQMALVDVLTRLANRRYLEQDLQMRVEEYRRFQVPFGILFMDIDRFKAVNDSYGHETGDRILKAVAGTLTANARPFDLFGRWGGEEFLGVIRNVDAAILSDIGNRLRMLIANTYLVNEVERISVTVSMGATLMQPDDSPETLVQRADALMYRSKADGRNRLTAG